MSHYSKISVKFTDAQALVAALAEVLGEHVPIEVHEKPVQLFNYAGYPAKDINPNGDMAEIVVRRQHIGGRYVGDVGFTLGENGQAFFDNSSDFNAERLGRVKQVYAKNVVAKQYAMKFKTMEQETLPDGRLRLRIAL